MKLQREIEFTVDGVEGTLKVVTGPFRCRVYQDGRLLEGEKHVYKVRTTDGGTHGQLRILRWFDNTVTAFFRETKKRLDRSLSPREYITGGIPLLLIPAVVLCGYNGVFGNFFSGMAGSYLVGFLGSLGPLIALIFNYTFMRIRKDPMQQTLFSVCTLLATAAITAGVLLLLGHILR